MRYLWLFVIFAACSPKPITYFKSEPIKITEVPHYSITEELNKIPKPDPIKRIYVKKVGNTFEISNNESSFVVLSMEEYKKVGALVVLAGSYKEIILNQELLVNSYIDQLNYIKALYELENKKSNQYNEMWINSENAYRQEEYLHKWDNGINRVGIYAMTVGSIVVLLLAL